MENYNKKGYLDSNFKIFHLKDTISKEFEFHYHDFHKITIFIKGNVTYYIEGRSYQLKPYDIVLVNRNEIHKIEVGPDTPYERIIVYISPDFMDNFKSDDYELNYCFEKSKKEHSNVLRLHSIEKGSIIKATERMEHSFHDNDYASSLYRQILFLEFMIQLNRSAIKNQVEFLDPSVYNSKISDIMLYINEHLQDDLDIESISKKFFISRYYMMRLFKSETGYTIGSYINYRRIMLVKSYVNKGMSLTEACFAGGFKDYSTFSRAYKSQFNEAPKKLLEELS